MENSPKKKRQDRIASLPLVGARTWALTRSLTRFPISRKYMGRVLRVVALNLILLPFRWCDHLASLFMFSTPGDVYPEYDTRENPPVFVLGHWRSGTTMLHDLLCKDPRAGYMTTYHSVFPFHMYGLPNRLVRWGMAKAMPRKRPTDNMTFTPRQPQEEGHTLINTVGSAAFEFFYFPKNLTSIVHDHFVARRFDSIVRRWYPFLVKRALRETGGTVFVSKNPENTARIPLLLELFPNARFVHIVRNPYEVVASSERLMKSVLQNLRLQDFSPEEVPGFVLELYTATMQSYIQHRDSIPDGQLVEVQFEDVQRDPVGQVQKVYEDLGLGDFEEVRPEIETWKEQKKDYKKGVYQFEPNFISLVNNNLGFAFEEWGYEKLAKTKSASSENKF